MGTKRATAIILPSDDLMETRIHGGNQRGATFVEAAIALPLFLGILIFSVYLLYFCFRLLRFQYGLSEATRQTFTLNQAERISASGSTGTTSTWRDFFEAEIYKHAVEAGLKESYNAAGSATIEFITASGCDGLTGWDCAERAQAGDAVSIIYRVKADILPNVEIAGLRVPDITFRSKSVATIQMGQSE